MWGVWGGWRAAGAPAAPVARALQRWEEAADERVVHCKVFID